MASLTISVPIHVLPLASPSSSSTRSSSTFIEYDLSPLSPLWDCDLLKPLSAGLSYPSTQSLTSSTPDKLATTSPAIRDAQRRLMEILSLTNEPTSTQNLPLFAPSQSQSFDQPDTAIPAIRPQLTTPPPPYAMHSPSKSTIRTPFSSYRRRHGRTPKSTLSFKLAAPVPRIPLASVLQYWAAPGSPSRQAPAAGDDESCQCKMDVDGDGDGVSSDRRESEYESAQSCLGLILGAGQAASQTRAQPRPRHTHIQTQTQTHLQSQSHSHSRSRYSRRLRRLAPAPLQLASTPRPHTLRALTQEPSPVTLARRASHSSSIFEEIPLNTCEATSSYSHLLDLDCIPCIPSLDLSASASPHSIAPAERRPSIASVLASMSTATATTSLAFPVTGTENVSANASTENEHTTTQSQPPTTHTNGDRDDPAYAQHIPSSPGPASHADLLFWRRTVSRALDSPLSPLRTPKSAPAPCKPSVQLPSLASAMLCTPAMSTRRLASMGVGQSDAGDICIYSPRMPRDAGPPPLRRTEWVALPEVTDEDGGPRSPASDVSRSPLCANLRLDLNAEDLALRAEKCAETIGRASLSLRSCSLLRDPEAIAELCENLRQAFRAVQRALDETPTEFIIDGSDAKQNWYTKHWETVDSLNKNLSLFFLLSRQIEDHPPRIHKLAPLLDKLATYNAKFTDLARRITLSYEKLRLLNLRTTLSTATSIARRNESEARARRREERSLFQEGRTRRRELREEMRHVRGTIRTLRDRHMEAAAHDENMNMMTCYDDAGMEREGRKTR